MQMDTGVCVLHLFCSPTATVDRAALTSAIADATSADCQVITAAMLGHKADIGVMAISNDMAVLHSLQINM
ncbi:MAG: chlorite dismutase, partial [Actinomycetota bacterium]|nr:chlorite dismutase [Actinomycetota bacterium]